MLAFLGRLFGSEGAVEGVIGGARAGIDALVYTEEERENDAKVERAQARSLLIEWLRNTQGQNLARRCIALIVVSMWAFMYFMAAVLSALSGWLGAEFMESAVTLQRFATGMSTELLVVLAFYFSATHLGKLIDLGIMRTKGAMNNG